MSTTELVAPAPSDAQLRPTSELLADVSAFVARYVVLGEDELTAIALWVLHTWAFDAAFATPYLLIVSPERGSGKSRLLEVLNLLARAPWFTASTSEAALFRSIEQDEPTLLLDEIDALFQGSTERSEALRAVLNAGNRRGATVRRMVGAKMETTRDFRVFCPKAIAGIHTGKLPDTITDRSITVSMRRRRASEVVERLRARIAEQEAAPLAAELDAWRSVAAPILREFEPGLPDELSDRMADAWEPLLAIADDAGDAWSTRARRAAVALCASEAGDELGLGAKLLAGIRAAMAGADRLTTAEILEAVNADDELPFGGWNERNGITSRELAARLRPYDVRPRKLRIGDRTLSGYRAEDLRDAWSRYLPASGAEQAEQAEQGESGGTENARGNWDVPDVPDVPPVAHTGVDVPDEWVDAPIATPEQEALAEGGGLGS